MNYHGFKLGQRVKFVMPNEDAIGSDWVETGTIIKPPEDSGYYLHRYLNLVYFHNDRTDDWSGYHWENVYPEVIISTKSTKLRRPQG